MSHYLHPHSHLLWIHFSKVYIISPIASTLRDLSCVVLCCTTRFIYVQQTRSRDELHMNNPAIEGSRRALLSVVGTFGLTYAQLNNLHVVEFSVLIKLDLHMMLFLKSHLKGLYYNNSLQLLYAVLLKSSDILHWCAAFPAQSLCVYFLHVCAFKSLSDDKRAGVISIQNQLL